MSLYRFNLVHNRRLNTFSNLIIICSILVHNNCFYYNSTSSSSPPTPGGRGGSVHQRDRSEKWQ